MVVKQSIWRPNKAYGSQQQKHVVVVKRSVQSSKTGTDGRLLWTQSTCADAPPKRSASRRGETSRRSRTKGVENELAERPKGRKGTAVVLCQPKRPRDLGPWAKGERSGQRERGQTQGKQTHTHEPVPCLTPSLGVKPLLTPSQRSQTQGTDTPMRRPKSLIRRPQNSDDMTTTLIVLISHQLDGPKTVVKWPKTPIQWYKSTDSGAKHQAGS